MWFLSPCGILFAPVSSARLNSSYLGRAPVLLISGLSEDKHHLIYSRCATYKGVVWLPYCFLTLQILSTTSSLLVLQYPCAQKSPWSLSRTWHFSSPNHKSTVSAEPSLQGHQNVIPSGPRPYHILLRIYCGISHTALHVRGVSKVTDSLNSGFYGLWESPSVVVSHWVIYHLLGGILKNWWGI